MADEKILIDGEQYISSGRAARLVGYTKDYVGQLARAGKIKATRVGRNWYINEDSINKHKVSVHYTLTKPKKKRQDERNDVGEKTTKNIDNSTTSTFEEKTRTAPRMQESDEFNTHDDGVLFPKIRKPARDPLLESDIRYEAHQVVRANKPDHEIRNASHSRAREHGVNMLSIRNTKKRVPIRDVRPERKFLRHQQEHANLDRSVPTGNPAIDGIVLSKKPHHEFSRKHEYRKPVQNVKTQAPDMRGIVQPSRKSRTHDPVQSVHQETYVHDEPAQEFDNYKENSKVFPVIGGIVIFTIITVIYILFFMGS